MKTIVMCPPQYFDVTYELPDNHRMDVTNRPNLDKARVQWWDLCEGFRRAGLNIILQPPVPGLPDLVFAANAGMPYYTTQRRRIFVVSNFHYRERKPETEIDMKFFDSILGSGNVYVMPRQATFEGQGDVVSLSKNDFLIGYGNRTNLEGALELTRLLRAFGGAVANPIILEMNKVQPGPKGEASFYHLDTCLLYLPQAKTFLLHRSPFNDHSLKILRELGKIVVVTEKEAVNMVCNSVVVSEKTLFMPWVNDRLRVILGKLGYTDIQVFPMSEFIKSGGAIKCLTLEI